MTYLAAPFLVVGLHWLLEVTVLFLPRKVIDTASGEEVEAIETSLIGGSANRNSTPQLTEIDHCVEITFLQDAVIDAVDVDEDRSEGVVARFRNAADLAIDLRDHGPL